jgi:hypothetical protein
VPEPNYALITYANLVAGMRRAQKAFFVGRSRSALEESKRLEREVDRATKDALTVADSLPLFGDRS